MNNVGQMPDWLGPLHLIPGGLKETVDTVQVNALSCALVSQLALRHMAARGGGLVVNLGSSMGELRFGYNAVYSCTKVRSGGGRAEADGAFRSSCAT